MQNMFVHQIKHAPLAPSNAPVSAQMDDSNETMLFLLSAY